eukprot:21512-Heterococcus_DN1.PRE.4
MKALLLWALLLRWLSRGLAVGTVTSLTFAPIGVGVPLTIVCSFTGAAPGESSRMLVYYNLMTPRMSNLACTQFGGCDLEGSSIRVPLPGFTTGNHTGWAGKDVGSTSATDVLVLTTSYAATPTPPAGFYFKGYYKEGVPELSFADSYVELYPAGVGALVTTYTYT